MLSILLQTLPFFALIAVGYLAARGGMFGASGIPALTTFVFYFALSAMLFRFAASLSLGELFRLDFVGAYLGGCLIVYGFAFAIARFRKLGLAEAAMEAQCAVIGNTGFLGVPMLVLLLGEAAAGPILMVLAIDLIVFSTAITLIITATRAGRLEWRMVGVLGLGLLKNPMIVSMVLGMAWGATGLALWEPADRFLATLGAAATPCALFAIGASLAGRSAERLQIAAWLSFAKLILHPAAVAVAALWVFRVEPFAAGVMIAAASLPVAGNVYILAQQFGVVPQRVSTAILVSTAFSVLTVSAVIAFVNRGIG